MCVFHSTQLNARTLTHPFFAFSICVNFGLNEQFNGAGTVLTNVRMDDTNPLKEVRA